jgi:hypothetical protein
MKTDSGKQVNGHELIAKFGVARNDALKLLRGGTLWRWTRRDAESSEKILDAIKWEFLIAYLNVYFIIDKIACGMANRKDSSPMREIFKRFLINAQRGERFISSRNFMCPPESLRALQRARRRSAKLGGCPHP